MTGEQELKKLLKNTQPVLNEGAYVFASVSDTNVFPRDQIICEFKEKEGISLVLKQEIADAHGLSYDFIAAWITLEVHSSLNAVGLSAAFAGELAKYDISCN